MISLTRLPLAAVVVVAASLCPGQVATLRVGNPSAAAPASAGKPEGKPPTGYVALTRTAPPMDGKGADPVWARAQALRLEWTLDEIGRAHV